MLAETKIRILQESSAMQVLGKLTLVIAIAVPMTAFFQSPQPVLAANDTTQEVTIAFQAKIGKEPFQCGKEYRLGKPATKLAASDFRLYISEVALIDRNGKAVPLELTQDNKWQYQNVALLDFEDKSRSCANGTTETHDRIIGKVPKGNYQGLKFTLGVPFNLNHADAAIAPSPLNLTSLWWNWLSGYKFLRVDLVSLQHSATKSGNHSPNNHQAEGFPIHLGSKGCKAADSGQKPSVCTFPNTSQVIFPNFNPQQHRVIVDLQALVRRTKLTANQANTPPGCMSSPGDRDCIGIMKGLGLPFAGKSRSQQQFFRFE